MGACSSSSIKSTSVSSPEKRSSKTSSHKNTLDVEKSIHVQPQPCKTPDSNTNSQAKRDTSKEVKDPSIVIRGPLEPKEAKDCIYRVPNPNNGLMAVVPHLNSIEESSLINRRRASMSPAKSLGECLPLQSRKAERHQSHIHNPQEVKRKRHLKEKQ